VEVDYLEGYWTTAGLALMCAAMSTSPTVGQLLREWRQRRRLSQLDLALEAEVSQRHVSFIEAGRATPSREMVLRLAEQMAVPLRERNALLIAAGYAPAYRERPLSDPDLTSQRAAIDLVLASQEPFPALAIDRHWTLVAANRAVHRLLSGIEPALLAPPLNVLRLSLHPQGLAPRLANYHAWREHVLHRLARQIEASCDPVLIALHRELKSLPPSLHHGARRTSARSSEPAVIVPFQLRTDDGVLSFFSTTTVFGTPVDITLSELAIELFFPADAETADRMRRLAASET
jgi:transcriptional regulator with XRE-family HTH domain